MGFLDRLTGAELDPQQEQLIKMLGGDPEAVRRRARARGFRQMGAALLGNQGRNEVARVGAGLAAGNGMPDEMSQLFETFKVRQGLSQMLDQDRKVKAMQAFAQDSKNFEMLPEQYRGYIQQQIANGDTALYDNYIKEQSKYKKPTAITGGAFMQRAAAEMGFDPNDASKIPATALPAIAKRAQELSLESRKAGASSTNVAAPDIAAFVKALSREGAGNVADFNDVVLGAEDYANKLDIYSALRGSDARAPGWTYDAAAYARKIPGIGKSVEQMFGPPGAIDRGQVATKLEAEMTLGRTKLLTGPTSDKDRDFLMSSVAGRMDSPEALAMQSDIAHGIAKQRREAADTVNKLISEGKIDAAQALSTMNEIMAKMPPVSAKFWQRTGYKPASGGGVEPAGGSIDDLMAKYGGGGG